MRRLEIRLLSGWLMKLSISTAVASVMSSWAGVFRAIQIARSEYMRI